jgi:diguanylate cyclase (GGDEF)-like protein/PAS domain S-box-containing protein
MSKVTQQKRDELEKLVEERTLQLTRLNEQLSREITERKKASEQLTLFAQAIQQSGSSIFITDPTGKIEFVNPAFIKNTGFTAEEAIGQNPRIIQSGLTPQHVYEEMWSTILSGDVWHGELLNRNKHGEYYWELVTIAPVRNNNGNTTHFIAVKDNISTLKSTEELYRSIINASPDSICIINVDGTIAFASPVAAQLFGYESEHELIGKGYVEFLAEEERERAAELLRKSIDGTNLPAGEYTGIRKDGSRIYLEINTALIHTANEVVSGIVAVIRDITRRKHEERAQREFSHLLENLNEVSMELSLAKSFDQMCFRAIELGHAKLGFDRLGLWFIDPNDPDYMIGSFGVGEDGSTRDERNIRVRLTPSEVNLKLMSQDLRIYHQENVPLVNQHLEVVGHGEQAGVALWDGNQVIGFLYIDNLLSQQPINERRRDLLQLFGQVIGHQGTIKRAQQEQERLASTDSLTGLFNRRYFFSLANIEFKKALRYGFHLSVIILDADHFKKVNDTYGHSAGDQALRHIAHILKSCQRETDIVARFGGEEFVILLPQTIGEDAIINAERIRVMIEESLLNLNERRIPLTVSLGVAGYSPGDTANHFDLILSNADKALYRAKSNGRNQVVKYHPDYFFDESA